MVGKATQTSLSLGVGGQKNNKGSNNREKQHTSCARACTAANGVVGRG
jgi:hypothetical protein